MPPPHAPAPADAGSSSDLQALYTDSDCPVPTATLAPAPPKAWSRAALAASPFVDLDSPLTLGEAVQVGKAKREREERISAFIF